MAREDDRRTLARREYVAALGSGGLAGLAGCSVLQGAERETTTEGPAGTATPDPATETTPDASATESETVSQTDRDGSDETWDDGGPPDRNGWTVTFEDAFDEGELDWDTWELGFGPGADTDCAGVACALERNVSVDPATDRLVLRTTDDDPNEAGPDGERVHRGTYVADYTTGAICTASSFSQTFGYFEAKAKIPAQPGGLPAFWAWPAEGNPPEIDFYEVFGDAPTTVSAGYHVDCNDNGEMIGRGAKSSVETPVDETFHVVGCEWGPDRVVWYVDGREVHRVDGFYHEECHTPTPMFPILNTHVIGTEESFASSEDMGDPADADYPYTHEFEWVRVWQRKDWASRRDSGSEEEI